MQTVRLNVPMSGGWLPADVTAEARRFGIKTEAARLFSSPIDGATWLAITASYQDLDGVCGRVRQLVQNMGVPYISLSINERPAKMYFASIEHDDDGEFPPMFERVEMTA